MSISIIPIKESEKTFSEILLVCISFETKRWKAYLSKYKDKYQKIILFYNKEFVHLYKDHIEDYKGDNLYELIETSINDPLDTADKYVEVVKKYKDKLVDIDCSTFTHEHILILIKIFIHFEYNKNINIIYTGVDEYSVGQTGGWLSKGTKDIRNVLGYSGSLLPSKQLHLIIMVGLENERIEKIIEEYEPNKITIGKCTENSSLDNKFSILNQKHHQRVDDFIKNVLSNINDSQEFEFSCDNPEDTYEVLNAIVNKNIQYNNIIIAGNSKISTLGVVKVTEANENVQLCYAQPLEYNIESYTSGIKDFRYFRIKFNEK